MKVSAILTLFAGLILGFFIGQATRSSVPSSCDPAPGDDAHPPPADAGLQPRTGSRWRTRRCAAPPTRW